MYDCCTAVQYDERSGASRAGLLVRLVLYCGLLSGRAAIGRSFSLCRFEFRGTDLKNGVEKFSP